MSTSGNPSQKASPVRPTQSPRLDFVLLIPYYNDEVGLARSLASIQYPSGKFRVLIVDDGSEPRLQKEDLIQISAETEVIRLEKNQGVVVALNAGLEHLSLQSDYMYIARLDCGDTCDPARFIEQVKLLGREKQLGIVGTWCRFVNTDSGKAWVYRAPAEHEKIVNEMHSRCCFIHPTVMFRREILATTGFYPVDFAHAEDYAYFWRILSHYRGAIIPRILVHIVHQKGNVSAKHFRKQLLSRKKIISQMGSNKFLKAKGIFLIYCRLLLPLAFIQRIKYYLYT